jgi:hypothetical protein
MAHHRMIARSYTKQAGALLLAVLWWATFITVAWWAFL